MVDTVAQQIGISKGAIVASLQSTQAPNLKAALRTLIRQITSQTSAEDSEVSAGRERYLSYDLQMLADRTRSQSIERVIIYIQDSESFPEAVLSDLIDLFRYCTCCLD